VPLPRDLLVSRLRNELRQCRRQFPHRFRVQNPGLSRFPVTLTVTLVDVPGPVREGDRVSSRYRHQLRITITQDYPYQTPIVRWRSAIFHPNIMPPGDGGYICTKLLDEWSFRSSLPAFIRGIESLLLRPNPHSPFDHDTCTRAAQYFRRHPYRPPLPRPRSAGHRKPVIVEEHGPDNR